MKTKFIQRTSAIGLLMMFGLTLGLQAQVTVGSGEIPAKGALLEIKDQAADGNNVTATKGGLGLPRVMLVDRTTLEPFIATTSSDWTSNLASTQKAHIGLTVYNMKSNQDTEPNASKSFRPGVYVWDGATWNLMYQSQGQRYFYIPSANIPLADATGAILTGDQKFQLYTDVYAAQFTKAGNPTFVSSNTNLNFVPSPTDQALYASSDLDYVVTYYDPNIVTINSISATGELSYTVKSLNTSAASFVNVVFVVKDNKLK